MPCKFVTIDGTNLPGVSALRTEYTALATGRRALSGHLRVDTLAGSGTKRAWRVTLAQLNRGERTSIRDLILSSTGIRNLFIDTVGTVTGTVRINADNQQPVLREPVGPLVWSDGAARLWSNGDPAVGNDVIANASGWFHDYGGGTLELRIEEA